jgi:AcrR family transcriptional regulator
MGRPVGRKGESRGRVLEAALELFSEHGVSGTSLQMIADRLGVTKAAVYHQFPSKSEIVVGVLSPVKATMATIAETAESMPTADARFESVLAGLVDLAIDNRAAASALKKDPVVARAIEADPQYRAAIARIDRLLIGDDPSEQARIALVLAGGALLVAGVDPALSLVDREALRASLIDSLRRLLRP